MNLPKRTTKKKLFLTALVLSAFLSMSAIGMVPHYVPANGNNATPAVSGGFASSGLWTTVYKDIFGLTILTTYFDANWTYSWNNGSWIHGYAIFWKAGKVAWDVVAWEHTATPQWANTGPNAYVGYGTGQYHIGIWYLSTTQNFYSQEKVSANSWGSGSFSSGTGSLSY